MRKAVLSLAAFFYLFTTIAIAAEPGGHAPKTTETIPVSQIHTGMRGVAYTVFEGTKPEAMDVEVLGVLKNMNGPKGDIILVRLHGPKVEYTGVVAGMSGSPVYLEGKLAGALAFRIGEFSKEPIAGVTPIADMLEINAFDKSPGGSSSSASAASGNVATKTGGPGEPSNPPVQNYANYLKPIEAPLVFNGFSEETVKLFAPQFASAGIVPVMGAGSVSDAKQPEPLEP
jgi:SpoIVB peptidase S55